MIKGFGFVVFFSAVKTCPFAFCRLGLLGKGLEKGLYSVARGSYLELLSWDFEVKGNNFKPEGRVVVNAMSVKKKKP